MLWGNKYLNNSVYIVIIAEFSSAATLVSFRVIYVAIECLHVTAPLRSIGIGGELQLTHIQGLPEFLLDCGNGSHWFNSPYFQI